LHRHGQGVSVYSSIAIEEEYGDALYSGAIPGDANGDLKIDVTDVQLVINAALGLPI